MIALAGFRSHLVFKDVTESSVADEQQLLSGNYIYTEVTNTGEDTVEIFINDSAKRGRRTSGIPIRSGETRGIPLALYNFRSTGAITIVAYAR